MNGLIADYFRKNWIIYSVLITYSALLMLNALGYNLWLPSCLITTTTGYSCYGCGLNRAAILLFQFKFTEAFAMNPLIYLYLIIIIGWISYDFYNFRLKLKQPEDE